MQRLDNYVGNDIMQTTTRHFLRFLANVPVHNIVYCTQPQTFFSTTCITACGPKRHSKNYLYRDRDPWGCLKETIKYRASRCFTHEAARKLYYSTEPHDSFILDFSLFQDLWIVNIKCLTLSQGGKNGMMGLYSFSPRPISPPTNFPNRFHFRTTRTTRARSSSM